MLAQSVLDGYNVSSVVLRLLVLLIELGVHLRIRSDGLGQVMDHGGWDGELDVSHPLGSLADYSTG